MERDEAEARGVEYLEGEPVRVGSTYTTRNGTEWAMVTDLEK